MSNRTNDPKQLFIRTESLERYDFIDGLDLIPLHAYDDKSLRDGKWQQDGKRPLDSGWQKRSYDPETVVHECEKHNRNVGVRIGPGWLVVDIDPRNGGKFTALQAATPGFDWRKVPRVRTGGGGLHLYLRKPPGKLLQTLADLPGIEFKSSGQVVAPGGIHPELHNYYEWDRNSPPLYDAPMAPQALLDKLTISERGRDDVTGGHVEPEQLAEALTHLDPLDFQDELEWRKLLFACHHATGGAAREEFIEWSTQDPKYAKDEWRIGNRWELLHADKADGITYRTLNKILRDHGAVNATIPNDPQEDFEPVESDGKAAPKVATALQYSVATDIEPKKI